MLKSLYIQNYAIIEAIQLDFGPGFNVITGETGAGKSILLGALGLIRGARADSKVLYDSSKKCIVEARIEITNQTLAALKSSLPEFSFNHTLELKREISSTGRSRAYLNGHVIKIQDLKKLSEQLIEIHNQFDTLSFTTPEYQLDIIDAVANNVEERSEYVNQFESYQYLQLEIKRLKNTISKSQEDQEYIAFQLEELEKINLDEVNKEKLESAYQTLSNAEEIGQILGNLNHRISESDGSIADQVREQMKAVQQFADHIPQLSEICENLDEVLDLIREIESLSHTTSDLIEANPQQAEELREQIDHLNLLENKHKVDNLAQLIVLRDQYRAKASGTYDAEAQLKQLQDKSEGTKKNLEKIAEKLSRSRKMVIEQISNTIEKSLRELAMPNAKLEIWHVPLEEFTASGMDLMTFAFSSNKGIAPQAIQEVASGGELSRLALSIRSMIAELFGVPTLIFDEIDTGISGGVALKLGHILEDIAFSRQVISITHSPQVAATAEKHFFVSKKDTSTRTITNVQLLDKDERVIEIAKMLSTDPPSKAAIENARGLLER